MSRRVSLWITTDIPVRGSNVCVYALTTPVNIWSSRGISSSYLPLVALCSKVPDHIHLCSCYTTRHLDACKSVVGRSGVSISGYDVEIGTEKCIAGYIRSGCNTSVAPTEWLTRVIS